MMKLCTGCAHFPKIYDRGKVIYVCKRDSHNPVHRGDSWGMVEPPRELRDGCWSEKKDD